MQKTVGPLLDQSARKGSLADGSSCRVIADAAVMRLAHKTGTTGRMVQIAALQRGILPERYLRNWKSLNETDQIRLLESHVCIVGLGGLGGLVTETLARIGVGRMTLIDGDLFESHNLNRQLLSSTGNMGTPKADAAARRVTAIDPGIEVTAVNAFLTPANAGERVGASHVGVDCLDNVAARFTLASAAGQAGIPMVSAAIAGLAGHVTTLFPGDKGLEQIYGPEEQRNAAKGEEIHLGCLAPGVNLIASLEANEVVNILLERKNILRNRLLVVDLADYTFESLQLV
jgi:molybdopterin/thiamine biosynthesis adenylyltransferase